jgi:hypothetical protein
MKTLSKVLLISLSILFLGVLMVCFAPTLIGGIILVSVGGLGLLSAPLISFQLEDSK